MELPKTATENSRFSCKFLVNIKIYVSQLSQLSKTPLDNKEPDKWDTKGFTLLCIKKVSYEL